MRKILIFIAMAAAPIAAAQAQNMTVADFVSRTDAMHMAGRGIASPEYQRLHRELNETAKMARNERRLARSQNRPMTACLRPNVRATTSDELARHLRSIPAEEARTMTLHQAYMQLMARKFPCRNG